MVDELKFIWLGVLVVEEFINFWFNAASIYSLVNFVTTSFSSDPTYFFSILLSDPGP
jgi:hypothetical protein